MKGKIMGKFLSLILTAGMVLSARQALAADDSDPIDETCKVLPSCEALGYAKGYAKECGTDERNYVLCPYDKEYRKCVNYTCEGLGFTKDDKADWCAEIIPCKFDSEYTLCKDNLGLGG